MRPRGRFFWKVLPVLLRCIDSTCSPGAFSLSMELYNADTGQLLCGVDTLKGSGSTETYDEKGFIAIPPCLWSEHQGSELPRPLFLPLNTTLLSIKRANSTWPHTGEMASWQMRGVLVSKHGHEDQVRDAPTTAARLRASISNADAREDV